MKKFSLPAVFAVMIIFVAGLSVPALADPDILVTPMEYNFGEVEVGDSSITTITIDNFNGHPLVISSIAMSAGSSADFYIATAPALPIVLDSDDLLLVDVVFSPSSEGHNAAGMDILSNDPDEGLVVVEFQGVGIAAAPATVTIEDILAFFDAGVEAGPLEGRGRRWVAKWRLNRFRTMILMAGIFIDNGCNRMACRVLNRAYLRSDGQRRPPDFVVGGDVPELNTMILELMTHLGCE